MAEQVVQLTEAQLRSIIKESVQEALVTIGIQADDPIEMQKDFQHLREWRMTTDSVKRKSVGTIVGILVAGGCAALWMGFKDSIKSAIGG